MPCFKLVLGGRWYCARRACSAGSARRAGVAQAVTAAIAKTAAHAARAAHAEAAFGSPYVPRPMLERAQVAAVPGAPVAPNVTAVCAPSAHRFRREHSIRCLYSLCRAHRLRCFLRTSRRARLCRVRLCRLRRPRRGIRASFAVPAAFASATSAAGAARGSSIWLSTGRRCCCLCCAHKGAHSAAQQDGSIDLCESTHCIEITRVIK